MSDELRGLTIRAKLPRRRGRDRREQSVAAPVEPKPTPAVEEVPRIARLLALAIVIEEMVRTGEVESYAEIARMAGVSRARVSQLMSLLDLDPKNQQRIIDNKK